MLERQRKELALAERDGEKHVELCLDASHSFQNLALFSVDIYFRANVTRRIELQSRESSPKKQREMAIRNFAV